MTDRDDRHWTLRRSHPMTTSFDGPQLALGESVEVVPADQLAGAVEENEKLRAVGERLATVVRTLQADGDLGPAGLAYLRDWEWAVKQRKGA